MGRDTVQLETAVSTISQEYLLEFTSEYSISEGLHPELPGRGDRIVDFPEGKNWNNRFFWVDEKVFLTVVDWRISAPKDGMPVEGTYSVEDVALLNTRRTPIQRQPEFLLCLIGLSRRYFLGDDVYPTFLYDDGREMDLFNLISAPNPATVKTGTRPRAAHEVPLLTTTTSRVIDMEDVVATSTSSGTPSAMEKLTLDFSNEDSSLMITNKGETENPVLAKTSQEDPHAENTTTVEVVPELTWKKRTDHASVCPESVTRGGKSLAAMGLGVDTPSHPPVQQNVSDPNPLSYAWPQPIPEPDIAQSSKGATVAGDPESEKSSSFTSFAGSPCGIYQPGCGITNSCRLDTPGVCQDAVDHMVPPGFEQEVRLLKKAKEKVAKRDQRIQAREEEIKKLDQEIRSLRVVDTEVLGLRNQTRNLETLLEVEVDVKKVEHGKAQLDLEAIEAYDPEADAKYVAVLHALKDLKYPLIDQLEKLKDLPPIDLIMTSLYFESDVREDTPQWIREIRPSSSQLKIPVYPKVRDPRVPWAFKEEMLLEDANMANVSRAEKKK
ncbi:hypothetical protein Tco_0833735 [Tanacetum coccineum]